MKSLFVHNVAEELETRHHGENARDDVEFVVEKVIEAIREAFIASGPLVKYSGSQVIGNIENLL